jgi:hypothetical protein
MANSIICSITGLFATGTIGFGALQVSGLNLVPSPPAIITAFMTSSLSLHERIRKF